MNLTMVTTAQWHREFVAYLAAECWALCEAHMVGVRRFAAANQARLLGNEPDVIAVANPARLGKGKHALVDSSGAPLPSAAEGNARRPWLHTLRLHCPLGQLLRWRWLTGNCGDRGQPRSKRVLDVVSVFYDEFALF
jgi:hypothetical protein